jgi:hypothetical protein
MDYRHSYLVGKYEELAQMKLMLCFILLTSISLLMIMAPSLHGGHETSSDTVPRARAVHPSCCQRVSDALGIDCV